jgi:hypothetical protein
MTIEDKVEQADSELDLDYLHPTLNKHNMGWSASQKPSGQWSWHAHWDRQYASGIEDTWAEASGAARKAFNYMEEHSERPE